MRISVLIENTKRDEKYIAEHGLSFYIERNKYANKCLGSGKECEGEKEKYVLDFGQSDAFLGNAKKLQIELTGEETCILSHAHYDHAGGLYEFFKEYPNAKVYAMKSCIAKENSENNTKNSSKYYSLSTGKLRHIGIQQEIIDAHQDKFILIEGVTKLSDDVYLVPHGADETSINNRVLRARKTKLFRKTDEAGCLKFDDFSHELTAVFRSNKGLWIINSCSHAGVEVIIEEIRALFPNDKIYAYVGGLHMQGTDGSIYSDEEIKGLAAYIKGAGIEKIYTGHCTGEYALGKLKEYLGDVVEEITTGSVIE